MNDTNIVGSLHVTVGEDSGSQSFSRQFGLRGIIDNINSWMDDKVHGLEEAVVHFQQL